MVSVSDGDFVQVSRTELEYLQRVQKKAVQLLKEEACFKQVGNFDDPNYNLHYYAWMTLLQVLDDMPKNL